MAENRCNFEWTALAVHPAVVKIVSKLLENYEKHHNYVSPTEFLESILDTGKVKDISNSPLEKGFNFGKPKAYELRATASLSSDENQTLEQDILTKQLNSSVNNNSKCEYPEVCKVIGSAYADSKPVQRKYDKSMISVACEEGSYIESSDNPTDSIQCHCPSDEDGSSSGVYTTSSSESSFSDQMADKRKSYSDSFNERSRNAEQDSTSSDQLLSSNILEADNFTGSSQFQNLDTNLANTKNSDPHYLNKLNICSKFGRRDTKQCFGYDEGAEDSSTSMKGLRIDDDYRQAVANLFVKIEDHREFINIVTSEFSKVNNHRIPSGFFKVLVYHLFFNLTPRTIEGIKKIIIHSYPGKILTCLKFLIADQLRQSIKEFLKYYDQQFVQEHAEVHAKGSIMRKLHDEVEEFTIKQSLLASKKEELERRNKSLKKQSRTSENQAPQEDTKLFKTDFRARPIPQSTYEAPNNLFLKKEKPVESKEKATGKKQSEKTVRGKHKKSVKHDKLPDEPKIDIDTFCSGCMEKEMHKSRRKETQKPENNTFVIDKDNMFPRHENHTFTSYPLTTTTGQITKKAEESSRQSIGQPDQNKIEDRAHNTQQSTHQQSSLPTSKTAESSQGEAGLDSRSGRPAPKFKRVAIPVKQTATSVLREGARLKQDEMKTLEKLESMAAGGANWAALEELQQRAREEAAQEELEALERKHLQGLLTHEEALLARQQLLERQRERADELRKEKEALELQLEEFRLEEEEKIRILVEKIHIMETAAKEKCKEVLKIKNEEAQKFAKEKKEQLAEMQRQRQEDLEQRIALIREVRALQGLTKMKKKEIDFTETAGYGLLYEMSIAELHERLNLLREEIREEIEQKRLRAQQLRAQQKEYIQQTQEYIKQQRMNRLMETHTKPQYTPPIKKVESEELQMLRQRLNEARKQRLGQT